ncbi:sialidase family protein [Paenibacillus sp. HJGM_3]|uniref:sialidase family protein n=1 Tax=Paenibacillus sp. HJGM_3 TaxID=3379816 RepID=UPI0038597FC5
MLNENTRTSEHGVVTTNRRFAREQEGFLRAVGLADNEIPRCSTIPFAAGAALSDFRGRLPGHAGPQQLRTWIEWETTPAESTEATVFTWIGGSQVRPVRAAFPYVKAALFVNGQPVLKFALGLAKSYEVSENGFKLSFEPRRFQSLVEDSHRVWHPHGISGFYRLEVPASHLAAGQPLRLRVELDPPHGNYSVIYYVSPRSDALRVDLVTLRDEVAQLQSDMVQLKKSHEMLYTQLYPEMFPKRINGKLVLIHTDDTLHYHPATVSVLSDGEIVVTLREATDHLSPDGRLVLFRSRDNGHSWGSKELLYDLGNADHRCGPIFELPNGDWVTTDYRYGAAGYDEAGLFKHYSTRVDTPTLWGAWSTDKGKSWRFTDKPMTVPDAPFPYVEVERHMIRLPNGRLLVAGNYCDTMKPDGGADYTNGFALVIFYSDDDGRSWDVLAKLPRHQHTGGEPTLLRTKSGKILLLARTERTGFEWIHKGHILQSESYDDGRTWSGLRPTSLSSMSSPAHLLQLQDGRILCSHGSREHPNSIYVTVSHDEGATWATEHTKILANDLPSFDCCYPTSGQLADGTIITVWYGNLFGKFFAKAMLYQPDHLG